MSEQDNPFGGASPLVRELAHAITKALVDDFNKSLMDATEEAGGALTIEQQLTIFHGWIAGTLTAAGSIAASNNFPWLGFLSLAGCSAAHGRQLNEGEEALHQMLHELMTAFPDGKLPANTIVGSVRSPNAKEAVERIINEIKTEAAVKEVAPSGSTIVIPKITDDKDKN